MTQDEKTEKLRELLPKEKLDQLISDMEAAKGREEGIAAVKKVGDFLKENDEALREIFVDTDMDVEKGKE